MTNGLWCLAAVLAQSRARQVWAEDHRAGTSRVENRPLSQPVRRCPAAVALCLQRRPKPPRSVTRSNPDRAAWTDIVTRLQVNFRLFRWAFLDQQATAAARHHVGPWSLRMGNFPVGHTEHPLKEHKAGINCRSHSPRSPSLTVRGRHSSCATPDRNRSSAWLSGRGIGLRRSDLHSPVRHRTQTKRGPLGHRNTQRGRGPLQSPRYDTKPPSNRVSGRVADHIQS